MSTNRIKVNPKKTETIYSQERPITIRGIQSFLSFYNFYRKFILNYREIAYLLISLTRKDILFIQTLACQAAFLELKARLINAPLLIYFNPQYKSIVETDSSNSILGRVFLQLQPSSKQHIVAYFSKTIILAKIINCPVYNKEILAIIRSLEAQQPELESSLYQIQVISDYKALEYFIIIKALSSRQAYQAKTLSQYNFLLTYKPGSRNRANPLTYRDQEADSQIAIKI